MQISEKQISILYVEDEPSMLDATKSYLEHKGNFIVDTALSGKEGLDKIPAHKYDAIISGYQMPEMNGLEFLKTVRSKGDNIPFIFFTGRGGEEVAIEALNAGADYYLRKGKKPKARLGELQNFIRQAVEKKQAEKEVPGDEQRMADVINFLPDATFATDIEGRVIAWNKAVEEMTGTPASEMIGKGDYEYAIPFYGIRRPLLTDLILHDELRNEVSYPTLNCENKDKFYAEVFLPHLHKGKGAYLCFTASPLYNTEGTIIGAIESIRDLTEYKQAEGLYKTIFENTGTAMAIIEDEVNISYANDRMKQLLGYSENDPEFFANWQERILEEDREKVLEYHRLRRTDPDSAPNSYDFRMIHKNGEIITTNLTTAMIPGTSTNIVSFIDITERKNAEKALKALNKKLNLLSSITSHDISNRLSVLMGYEEMLKDAIEDETASSYLNPIIKATDMIQEQIEFARIYQVLGQNSPKWQPVEYIISSVVSNLPMDNIKIKTDTGKLEIYADNMLEKVFYNLFENAIRHGEHVTGFRISFYEKEGNGILVIEDNGKGVAGDMKEKIFKRGVGSNTGLGLFLTKEILDITEICISETGTEGRGARFEIVVPKSGYRFKKRKDPDKTNPPGNN